jgi:hypothetical protein
MSKSPRGGGSARKGASKDDGSGSELSDIDADLDLEMESIPLASIAQDPGEPAEAAQPAAAEDSDDDEFPRADGNKFAPLYDFLLTQDQIAEEGGEWTYDGFLAEIASEEAELGTGDLEVLTARTPR